MRPHPIPRAPLLPFTSAILPGGLLRAPLKPPPMQHPLLQTEITEDQPTAILGKHLSNLKQLPLQKIWIQAAGLVQTVSSRMIDAILLNKTIATRFEKAGDQHRITSVAGA